MRIVGLITEYNPFHNGHLHHLRESLQVTNANASVAVMSGHFLQRGEPALLDKWMRTEMALAAGVDLVLELPFPFACNSAPHFARGAVQSLDALGVVDAICFGSESGGLQKLEKVADVLVSHARKIESTVAAKLREGVNYPAARAHALKKYLPGLSGDDIASPNNILGVEYLRALKMTAGSLQPYTIKRLGAGYHDKEAVGEIASATGIRHQLSEGQDVSGFLPQACRKIFEEAVRQEQVLDLGKLFIALQTRLLSEPETLDGIYHIEDGLDRRLCEQAMTATDYKDLALAVKSRHWTLTRIQRILSYVLLQVTADEMNRYLDRGPLYLRLLGSSDRGNKILAKARKEVQLPIVSDPARARNTLSKFYRGNTETFELAMQMLQVDLRATRLHGLLLRKPVKGSFNRDYYQPFCQVD